jgi:1-deoxy-D-xylulose-5-phosphate synthase
MVAITPATAEGSGLVKFGKIHPKRFFDVAICEQHAITMAAGMAKTGLKPVVSIYSTFLQRGLDQVIHDVAILNLPVVFGIDRGGLVEDGETHQGVFDIAYLRSIPNFTVLAPKDAAELRNMTYTAIKEAKGPVAIRFPRDKAINADGIASKPFETCEYSKWEVLHQGGDLTVLAYGAMVATMEQALPLLLEQGIAPTVINARSAKPLDESMLERLIHNPKAKIVTIEEGVTTGGFGTAVLEFAARLRAKNPSTAQAQIVPLGIDDNFVEHGSRQILLDLCGLSTNKIADFLVRFAKG